MSTKTKFDWIKKHNSNIFMKRFKESLDFPTISFQWQDVFFKCLLNQEISSFLADSSNIKYTKKSDNNVWCIFTQYWPKTLNNAANLHDVESYKDDNQGSIL